MGMRGEEGNTIQQKINILDYILGLDGRFSLKEKIYNSLFGASQYSRTHYQSGKFQYQSFRKGLLG